MLKNSDIKIIAEGEINHNGQVDIGKELIEAAKLACADSVKFQCFNAQGFISPGSSFFPIFQKTQLSVMEFKELRDHADKVAIEMFSTAADLEGLAMIQELDLPIIKIGSTNITHTRLLSAIAETGKPVYLSTGASSLGEIGSALEILSKGIDEISLFHCTVQYPADSDKLNLRAIATLLQAFPGLDVGYSDHSVGVTAAVAAVALGATMLEKHFTINHDLPGPDHTFSANPSELREYVEAVRKVSQMLGSGEKIPFAMEEGVRLAGRRYITAFCDLNAGDRISAVSIRSRRIDISSVDDRILLEPAWEERIQGAKLRRSMVDGEVITLADLDFSECD